MYNLLGGFSICVSERENKNDEMKSIYIDRRRTMTTIPTRRRLCISTNSYHVHFPCLLLMDFSTCIYTHSFVYAYIYQVFFFWCIFSLSLTHSLNNCTFTCTISMYFSTAGPLTITLVSRAQVPIRFVPTSISVFLSFWL